MSCPSQSPAKDLTQETEKSWVKVKSISMSKISSQMKKCTGMKLYTAMDIRLRMVT